MQKMKRYILLFFVGCFIGLLSSYAQAQDMELTSKEKRYYNNHPEQILPAAKTAFTKGDYLQTQKLCRWHYIVVGDDNAERISLDNIAKECASLLVEIISLRDTGKLKEAKTKAQQLLKLNPDDAVAKETMLLEEPIIEPESKQESKQEPVPEPETEPTKEEITETATEVVPVPVVEQEPNPANETEVQPESVIDQQPSQQEPSHEVVPKYRTRFGLAAGAMACNLNDGGNLGPEVAIGVYDIAGSHIGLEIGGFYPVVKRETFGIDALMAIRIVRNLYVKAGAGAFMCSSDALSGLTKGLCIEGGLSYILFNHLSLNATVRYMPEVKVLSSTQSYVSGVMVDNLVPECIVSAGVCPSFSVGWLF